jgi:error-prone DNA polymerase
MSRINEMREEAAKRIVAARASSRALFARVEDLAMWAELDARDLGRLSSADALVSLVRHRPDAAWAAKGVDTRQTKMLREARTHKDPIGFAQPEEAQQSPTATEPSA